MRKGFTVEIAERSAAGVLENLFEFYLHDMAEWFKFDQLPDGSYTQSTERYWQDGRYVYLLYAADIPVGFALVGPADTLPHTTDMNEFFVVRRHRRAGVASEFAEDVWRRHAGNWLVRVYRANEPALPFWRKTIARFTNGNFVEETHQAEQQTWSYFTFETRPGR